MPSTSSKRAAPKAKTAKPYDRPAKAAGKGKAKATATATAAPKAAKLEDIGAPAQLAQTSRKGKKAWRKNVDVRAEEQALEAVRAEERLTGGQYSKKTDGDLFTIDTEGDVEVRRRQRVKKPLRSLAVLNETSAMPSLTARVVVAKKKPAVTAKEKARIRKIARRTVDDRTSADVRKTDLSSLRDAWGSDVEDEVPLPSGGFGLEGMVKPKVKAPQTIEEQRQARLAISAAQLASELPAAGVSYNPAVEAHSKLIEAAAEEERKRLAAEEREAERLRLLGEVVASRRATEFELSDTHVDGMAVGLASDSEDDDDAAAAAADEPALVKKPTKRKTQAQRNKAKRAKEAAQAQKDEARRRKLEKAIPGAKSLGKTVEARQKAIDEAKRLRQLAKEKRERAGYRGGEKVGKFKVAEQAVPVQLGEDLAESLRQVKPEGNLFKDRFLSLQRRALLEPRVPHLPKRRALKVKEYEKHAYKRFK